MTALPQIRMTVDEFLTWYDRNPGRYELKNGIVYTMSPEGAGHAEVKFAVQTALAAGIRTSGLPCHMLPDGMTVRIDEATAYEPDALVYCGAKLPSRSVEVANPVIVVEVLSPSTGHIDATAKLADYFKVGSIAHYLIIDPEKTLIVHHARGTGDVILARVVTAGSIVLDPPGIEITVKDIYGA